VKNPTKVSISNLLPPPLPLADALQLAKLARVPQARQESFFDLVHWTISLVWMRDGRGVGVDVAQLERVAEAARTLHQEFGKLDPLGTKWVERLSRRTPWYNEWLRDVPETAFRLAHLLSSTAGMSPPRPLGVARPKHQKSNRDKTRADVMFLDFLLRLKKVASESGGKLGVDPAHPRGGYLVDAVDLLKPHLPVGVVPDKFPFSALKKAKGATLLLPIAEIDFYSLEPPA
jgi:hypothetical protein